MSDLFEKLAAPFSPDDVSWRVGSTTQDKKRGMALAYLDARAVMERLDSVCGPANWQNDYPHANGKTVCRIGIKVDGEWVWKSDGAGDTDFEADKGALSDAFKRAAVRWGIGRYLYNVDAPWVEIESAGKSYRIKDSERPKLARLLNWSGGEADHSPPPGKATFIALAKSHIDAATNVEDLTAWWQSDAQKNARRAAGLEQSEVNELKELVIAKKAALKPKAA